MKKTLIVLAALAMASVASAASTPNNGVGIADATYTTPTGIVDEFSGVKGSFTMQLVLDWDTAMTNLGDWKKKTEISTATGTALWNPLNVRLFKHEDSNVNALQVAFGHSEGGDGTNPSPVQNITPLASSNLDTDIVTDKTSLQLNASDYKNADGKLILFTSYDASANTFTLFALRNDGYISSYYFNTTMNLANDDYKYVAMRQIDGTGSVVTGSIANPGNAIESIAVFDHAMDKNAVKYYMQTSIPEPATATLSLLALAGLAARRRRK